MILLVPLMVAAVIVLLGLYIFGEMSQRAEVRDALRQLDGYQIENVREQEMLAPINDRVFKPLIGKLSDLVDRFSPAGYEEQVRHRLELAGNPVNLDTERFMAFKVIGLAAWPFNIWFVYTMLKLGTLKNVLALGILCFMTFRLADIYVQRKVDERRKSIQQQLPDVLDLLTISVEAGLGFEQALERTAASVPGVLSDEFQRMLHEVRVGSSRSDAMKALDERTEVPELRGFILAVQQADKFGVSIGRVLRSQADEMRIKRRQRAQEKAQQAPVKMLIPMVLCIFPAIFVVILGPAAINMKNNL